MELGFNALSVSGGKDLRRRVSGPGQRQEVLNRTESGDSLGAGLESEIEGVEEEDESGSACLDTIVPFDYPIQVTLVLPFPNGEKAIFTAGTSCQLSRPIFSKSTASAIQQLPRENIDRLEVTVEKAVVDGFLPEGRTELNTVQGSSMAEIKSEAVGPLSCLNMLRAIEMENSPDQTTLLELILSICLDSRHLSGHAAVLTEMDQDHLVHTVKRNFTIQRICLVDIR